MADADLHFRLGDMSRVTIAVAANVAVVAFLVGLTVVANRHLTRQIDTRRASYRQCVHAVRSQARKQHVRRTAELRAFIRRRIASRCAWSNLAREKPADMIGSAFLVLALALFDLLLWFTWISPDSDRSTKSENARRVVA